MASTRETIEKAYSAFNDRDVEAALALMTEDISWPKASEGGRVVGKDEIRAYWTRQWQQFDPRVEPIKIVESDQGKTVVTVHQIVKNLSGESLFDSEVVHVYTIVDGLLARMDLGGDAESTNGGPSAAFGKH